MMKKHRHYLWSLVPLVILGVAIWLRFHNLSNLLYFMIDEERYSFLMKRLYLDHKLMLVGVAIPGGIYLGPAYFYFSGLIQLMLGFNPAMMGVVASLAGVASTGGVYVLARKFWGKLPATIAMSFYGMSYLIVIYNRIYWTLTWSSLAALVTYWGLDQIITAKKYWYLYPMTGLFILGSHSDASYFSLVITTIIVLARAGQLLKKPVIMAAAILVAAQLPLVAFDMRHGFYNSKLTLRLFHQDAVPSLTTAVKSLQIFPKTLARLFVVSPPYDVTYQLAPTESAIAGREKQIGLPLVILSTLILMVFTLKIDKEKSLLTQVVKTHLWVAVIGVFIYNLVFPGYTHEWFVTILFPALALVVAWTVQMMIRMRWGVVVVPVLLLMLAGHVRAMLATDNDFGFGYKKQAVEYALAQVGKQPFYLDAIGSQAYGGYRYLFWLYGREPVHSFVDNIYGDWIYPLPALINQTEMGVIMVSLSEFEPEEPEDMIKAKELRQKAIATDKFGGVEVLVIPH